MGIIDHWKRWKSLIPRFKIWASSLNTTAIRSLNFGVWKFGCTWLVQKKSFTYCHTRPYLGIEAQLKIWKPTHPTTRPPGDLDSFAFLFNHFSFWQISLVGSSPNFKLKLMWLNPTTRIYKMRTTSNGRGPQILKVKLLSNHLGKASKIKKSI